ncbi:uncharacterized protein LOC123553784 [Mercenaria mercenaria]|uniref:uncharacterized protein LOC123553784 n=1 Tax=Mercenaria mercenaria TaxID=6596 RepID=UPI00234E482E|nr:uncharacterized protein LOC123553784 [Mercenaria mercenaria]
MNIPGTYSSSSCSSDYECDYIEEKHFNKRCKYERHRRKLKGQNVYFHIRLCICGEFDDKRYLRRRLRMNLEGDDGVDIHFYRSCKWIRTKLRQYGERVYILSIDCEKCTEPHCGYKATPYAMNNVEVSY